MGRTYLRYTDNLDAGEASIYIEMGECSAVPVKNALVHVDGVLHIVVDVLWDVYETPSRTTDVDQYPQQCATVLLQSQEQGEALLFTKDVDGTLRHSKKAKKRP